MGAPALCKLFKDFGLTPQGHKVHSLLLGPVMALEGHVCMQQSHCWQWQAWVSVQCPLQGHSVGQAGRCCAWDQWWGPDKLLWLAWGQLEWDPMAGGCLQVVQGSASPDSWQQCPAQTIV